MIAVRRRKKAGKWEKARREWGSCMVIMKRSCDKKRHRIVNDERTGGGERGFIITSMTTKS